METFLQKNTVVPTYKYNRKRNNLNSGKIIVELIKAEFDPGHSTRAFGILEEHKARGHDVGPCHHGMARPRVADGGMASYMEGSCE